MRVDVAMPQMGESIAEGTITRWIRKVGERVERDEPIFEISTDKVDAEIPSPAAGVLAEIRNGEGETVPVNEIVAVIETDGSAAESAGGDAPVGKTAEAPPPAATPPQPRPAAAPTAGGGPFLSPVVRRIAEEHRVDPRQLRGTGAGGRVTKKDILEFIRKGGAEPPAPAAAAPVQPRFAAGERTSRETMSVMRKKIAEHMVESRRASAHVQSVFEIDLTTVARLRGKHKQAYLERHGAKLTFMPFFIKAVCDGLKDWPVINASVEGDEIVYKKDLNIGIAVALDRGLIVPVIRNAEELSIAGLAKRVQDLALRARNKQLSPDEVQEGTFTITNPGQFGGLFGLPIINQPQVAILAIGAIQRRPVVIDEAIAIRSMAYVALSYDHRVVDGAVADQFLAQVKHALENFDESLL